MPNAMETCQRPKTTSVTSITTKFTCEGPHF